MIVKNDLFDYKNRMIFQESKGFKFSLDSILLAEFVDNIKENSNVLDMCMGNGAVPLILSTYFKASFIGFEIQKDIYKLACKSISYNKLENQISIINDDIKNITNYYTNDYFDCIVCNPPFFKLNDLKVTNIEKYKQIARHEVFLKLEDIFSISKKILKDNGQLYLVHRPERLDEIFILANKYGMNVKKVQFVSTKVDNNPSIVLVKCIKNSKIGIIVKPIVCIDGLKTYKNIFKEK